MPFILSGGASQFRSTSILGVMHGGHPITSGVRYILVAFVIVEGYQNWAMRFMKDVWDY